MTEHSIDLTSTVDLTASGNGHPVEHDDPLSRLALKYGTDKGRDHWYTPHYHRRFAELREKPITLLEIGIGGYNDPSAGGKSLRMWRDYFPNAVVVGLDITPHDPVEGCFVEMGDATDNRVLTYLGKTYGPFDIVIDDGSHVSKDIMQTWVGLWAHVRDGGWYVIEDLGTAYDPAYGGSAAKAADTTIGFLQGLIDRIHWREFSVFMPNYTANRFDQTVVGLEVSHELAFILKGSNR